jgi:hypothetical protein
LITHSRVDDVGFKVDNGEIERLSNLTIVETVPAHTYYPPYVKITCIGNATLSNLSEGNHKITVYHGFQYEGINKRYEVTAREGVSFIINKQINVPEFPSWTFMPLFLVIYAVVLASRNYLIKKSR